MKTGNFPRVFITHHRLYFGPTEQDWLISITDEDGTDAETNYTFGKTLFMKFNDTTKIGEGEISLLQAEDIADFIKEAKAEGVNLWVNCHAGICRSGAIVSLLGELGWEIDKRVGSPGRIPNWLVYDRVRKHFPDLKQSWDPATLMDLPEDMGTIWLPPGARR
jgi:hypothetical protein